MVAETEGAQTVEIHNGIVDAGGEAEVVSIYNQALHLGRLSKPAAVNCYNELCRERAWEPRNTNPSCSAACRC